MSLVAAYSDSESENEVEDTISENICLEKVNVDTTGELLIEDEDEWRRSVPIGENKVSESAENELFSHLPQPNITKFHLLEEVDDEFIKKKPITEDDLYVKEKALLEKEKKKESVNTKNEPLKRSLLILPKPTKKDKNKRQPVKISIPTLQEIGADSDSDGEESKPISKVTVSSNQKASALFSLLPKPRHSVTVGENKNKVFQKQTNRVLVPHTLTKKKEPPASLLQTTNIKKLNTNINTTDNTKKPVQEESSDEEDEDEMSSENFFSIDNTLLDNKTLVEKVKDTEVIENVKNTKEKPLQTVNKNSLINTKTKSLIIQNTSTSLNTKGNSFFSSLFNKSDIQNKQTITSQTTTQTEKEIKSVIESNNNSVVNNKRQSVTAPYKDNLDSNATKPYSEVTASYSEVTAPYSGVTAPYGGVTAPYGGVSASYGEVTAPYNSVTGPYSAITGSYNTGQSPGNNSHSYPNQSSQQNFFAYEHNAGHNQQDGPVDYYNQPNEDLPIDRDALTALQGKKRRREEINLIDINASDLQSNRDDYIKNLTKESGYKTKKPKNDQPKGIDKKKHQITYLAFQAKEREFELRQSWADSRASKQQTQSRYGF